MDNKKSHPVYKFIFVHSHLDELKLLPSEFRVFAHLVRRMNFESICFPGIRSIAENCRISKETAIAAIEELERRGMVAVQRPEGRANIYTINHPDAWRNIENGVDENKERLPNAEETEIGNGYRSEIRNVSNSKEVNPRKRIQKEPVPTIDEMEIHALSIGADKRDGQALFHKLTARGWPQSWRHEMQYQQLMGWLPSQKNSAPILTEAERKKRLRGF